MKEVEAGDIGIEDLSFERGVRCTINNEEVKTLCRVRGPRTTMEDQLAFSALRDECGELV